MSTRRIHVFISHSWSYSGHYETLKSWIFQRNWRFGQASAKFHNYSIPKYDPIHNARTVGALRDAIYNQIRRSHVVVIPTGMYASHSKWIRKEIDGARKYGKPILAVDPRGQKRASSVVRAAASRGVGWTGNSVGKGIWELYYRGA